MIGYFCRFDRPNGEKLFCPLTWCENVETGECAWRWKSWQTPRPLYGLDRLAAEPDAPVIVCEGEKAADAAQELLPDHVVVTSPNGSKSAGNADWSPLAGRTVTIWPDNDEAGVAYASDIASALRKLRPKSLVVGIINLPSDLPDGWDAADALADGWNLERAQEFVADTCLFPHDRLSGNDLPDAPQNRQKQRRSDRIRENIHQLVEGDGCELWHDEQRRAFATVPVDDHFENLRIASPDFITWLCGRFFAQHGGAIGDTLLKENLRLLEAKAIFSGVQYRTFRRIGRDDNRLYVDLGDVDWQIIAIDPDGWKLADDVPLKAIRSPSTMALPMPEAGDLLEDQLRPLLNVATDRDLRLIVAWMVSALGGIGEYPVLSINGEQGSAKSTIARMIRMLVDPNTATNRAAPRDERDLIVAANNAWVVSVDNISTMSQWLSDALCRIATGGGFSTRALHTDMDEVVVNLENPIILNGIPEIAGRPDLADRSIMLTLPALKGDTRRSKDELWAEFEQRRPFILGALFDAVSAALRNFPNVELDKLPRMANAAKWVTAAEAGLGWEPGTHLADLEANRQRIVEASVDSEPVALGIMGMSLPWEGTKAELHTKLAGTVAGFPKTVQQLGIAIKRVKPMLAQVGIEIIETRGKDRRARIHHAEN